MGEQMGTGVDSASRGGPGAALDRLIPAWVTPNHLTVLRMLGALVMLGLGVSSAPLGWLVAVGLVTGFSDNFDGWLARRRGLTTELGALLDPMADKLLAAVLFVVLWWRGLVEVWLLLLAASTELHAVALPILIGLRRRREGRPIWPPPKVSPNRWGKVKTAWVASAMGFVIMGAAFGWPWLKDFGTWNIGVGAALGFIAMARYFMDWRAGAYV